VASVVPGRNTTSAATIGRSPGSVRSWSTASALSAETEKAAIRGIRAWTGAWCPATERIHPTKAPSTAAATTSGGAGWRIRQMPAVSTA
jgi:hypothetical protein